jgi:hypothetical protein
MILNKFIKIIIYLFMHVSIYFNPRIEATILVDCKFPRVSTAQWLSASALIYCFTSRSRIFHLYGDVTITGEGLQNLGLCSALRAFEQGEIFIVPHLL